jgi:hypothetical protein
MRKAAFIYIAVASIAALLWWRTTADAPPSVGTKATHAVAASSLPVESVLLVRPTLHASARMDGGTSRPARAVSPELAQFRARRDYAALYQALEASPQTPESLYIRAEIYSRCAGTDGKTAEDVAKERASRRDKLMAALSQGPADTAQRIDAFDKMNVDPCQGLDLGTFKPQELTRMIAADAGDVRAKAWQLAERIERAWDERRTADRQRTGYDLSPGDFEQARQLLASGDPEVIQDLQGMLSSSLEHGSIRLGGLPVDQAAIYAAFSFLACDAGAACGPDSPVVLRNCVYRGRCAAASFYEYMYYYETSPADAQLIDSYRRTLQAMLNAGDLSG